MGISSFAGSFLYKRKNLRNVNYALVNRKKQFRGGWGGGGQKESKESNLGEDTPHSAAQNAENKTEYSWQSFTPYKRKSRNITLAVFLKTMSL